MATRKPRDCKNTNWEEPRVSSTIECCTQSYCLKNLLAHRARCDPSGHVSIQETDWRRITVVAKEVIRRPMAENLALISYGAYRPPWSRPLATTKLMGGPIAIGTHSQEENPKVGRRIGRQKEVANSDRPRYLSQSGSGSNGWIDRGQNALQESADGPLVN